MSAAEALAGAGMARKYRWLTEGHTYTYGPKVGKGDDSRRGTLCQVVTLPLPGRIGNALVRWPDGYAAVVPSGVLRKPAPTVALSLALAQAIAGEGEG